MLERAVGVVDALCAVGLGENGVEAKEDAADSEGQGVVHDLSEGSGAEGDGGVGQVPDHDGVDDAHHHPTDLGEYEREGEVEHGRDFAADGHGSGFESFRIPAVGDLRWPCLWTEGLPTSLPARREEGICRGCGANRG